MTLLLTFAIRRSCYCDWVSAPSIMPKAYAPQKYAVPNQTAIIAGSAAVRTSMASVSLGSAGRSLATRARSLYGSDGLRSAGVQFAALR